MSESVLETVNEASGGKKPYVKPMVVVYGDMRQITQAVGNTGNTDGAADAPQQTAL